VEVFVAPLHQLAWPSIELDATAQAPYLVRDNQRKQSHELLFRDKLVLVNCELEGG